jgi:hypothetical protein
MIKLLDILENKILVPLRSKEERSKNYQIALQKKVQQYMKDGGKGDLNLRDTPITSLPPDLSVGGNLSLGYAKKITSLPPGLKVKGDLYLYNTKITSLPSDLKVKGDLDLDNSKITSLPSDLKVGGDLNLSRTPLSKSHTKKQIRQMAPGVKGTIYM